MTDGAKSTAVARTAIKQKNFGNYVVLSTICGHLISSWNHYQERVVSSCFAICYHRESFANNKLDSLDACPSSASSSAHDSWTRDSSRDAATRGGAST